MFCGVSLVYSAQLFEIRRAAWSFSEHSTAVDVINRFPGCLCLSAATSGDTSVTPLSSTSLPLKHFHPPFSQLVSFFTSPHLHLCQKVYNSRMWSHTTSCFCNSAKKLSGLFFFFFLFFLCKAVQCPALRGPWRNVTHGCDHSLIAVSVFRPVRVKMLRRRPRRSFKSTVILLYFTNHVTYVMN